MPSPTELPDSLKDLAFRNAAQVDAGRDFHQHMERLIRSMDRLLEPKLGRRAALSGSEENEGGSPLASNVEHISARNRGAARGVIDALLAKYGLRFSDAQMEAEFLAYYRERFYALGLVAFGIGLVGWLLFGSTALVASQGKDLDAIKFFFIATPIWAIAFLAGFSNPAKRFWQVYYSLAAMLYIALVYLSARLLQDQSWFRPEYVTMAFLGGMTVLAMAPIMTVYAAGLLCMEAVVALYYILYDLRMAEFPTLYAIFSSLYVGAFVVIGCCITVTRERVVRGEFAASRELGRRKRV